MTQPTRRRFIAGAVCPRCGLMDKIAIDMDGDCRFCVSCGFSEERPGHAGPGDVKPGLAQPVPLSPSELPTRVSRAPVRRPDTPAQVLRVVDPRREDGRD